jgi:hypothetical protein
MGVSTDRSHRCGFCVAGDSLFFPTGMTFGPDGDLQHVFPTWGSDRLLEILRIQIA